MAAKIENAGGMNSTGARKISLTSTKLIGHLQQYFESEAACRSRQRGKLLPDKFNARLAANSATTRNGSETLRRHGINVHLCSERNIHNIAAGTGQRAMHHLAQISAVSHNSFREQKPGRKFLVLARCAHGDRDRLIPDPNLQWFLQRNLVRNHLVGSITFASEDGTGADAIGGSRFHPLSRR